MSIKQLMSVPLKQLVFGKKSLPVLIGVTALAAFLLLSGVGHSRTRPQPAASAALPQVTVAEVIHRPLREWQEFSGRLQAVNTVEIRPRVARLRRSRCVHGRRARQERPAAVPDRPAPVPGGSRAARRRAQPQRLGPRARERQSRTLGTAHRGARHLARGIRAATGRRGLRSGRLGLDRRFIAGGAAQSGVHRSARADRRSRIASHHHGRKPRDERQHSDDARLR